MTDIVEDHSVCQRVSKTEIKDQFIKQVNEKFESTITSDEAFKFLRAKKFDITSALELFNNHKSMRIKEQLLDINPRDKKVYTELLSEKFTFLLQPEPKTGSSICIFTAKLHFPSRTTHQNTLKALIFQLDAALSSVLAQENGLIFVYDMNGSLYSNFDFHLSVKILNLLKGAYPARLCKVIIYTPPLWFRASFNFLRLFVREKLQDRIWILTTIDELHSHFSQPLLTLPTSLGGQLVHEHRLWLKNMFNNMGFASIGDDKLNGMASELNGAIKPSLNGCQQDGETDEYEEEDGDCVNSTYIQHQSQLSPDSSSGVVSGSAGMQTLSTPDVDEDDDGNEADDVEVKSEKKEKESVLVDDEEFEMMSVSSWEFNLEPSGDEDVICADTDFCPNLTCSSPKTPIAPPTVQLKRRNALRQSGKFNNDNSTNSGLSNSQINKVRLPSWSLYRPDNGHGYAASLHRALVLDTNDPAGEQHDEDEFERGVTIDYFVHSEAHSFYSTLNEFRNDVMYGDIPQFVTYGMLINAIKNRYSDIQCMESSRVKLVRHINYDYHKNPNPQPAKPTDYIHANWVDGYRQKNAYICTQGPLLTTCSDFWHMIVQYRSPIIVMTTRPREQNRDKCQQYWPEEIGETKIINGINASFDQFEITNLRAKEFGPHCPQEGQCSSPDQHWYRVTLLHIKNLRTKQEHRVNHFYFHSWPDQGIPQSGQGFLHFILQIRQTYRLNIAKLGYESEMDQTIPPPPIIVHCSAGIGRTGTYIVTEICCKSLSDCGRFNLHQTMLKVRSQRYKCVQNAYQYLFCRNTIIDYARYMGLLPSLTVEDAVDEDNEEHDVEEEAVVGGESKGQDYVCEEIEDPDDSFEDSDNDHIDSDRVIEEEPEAEVFSFSDEEKEEIKDNKSQQSPSENNNEEIINRI